MTSDINIYRAANELMKQHGNEASIHASMRHDKLLDAGDVDGTATRERILRANDELLATERPEGTIKQ